MRNSLMFLVPIKTKTGLNFREHWAARAKRVKGEKAATALCFRRADSLGDVALFRAVLGDGRWPSIREKGGWLVTLTRVSPGTRAMDDDNLPGALKAIRDEVSKQLGVDDGDRQRIRFQYGQERGDWGVRVEILGGQRFEAAAQRGTT